MFKIQKIISTDLKNKILYGKNAPLYAERIWINPSDLKFIFQPRVCFKPLAKFEDEDYISGMVIENNFPSLEDNNFYIPIAEQINIKETIEHFVKGVSWQETGAYDRVVKRIKENNGFADGCYNLNDVIKRYSNIDKIFESIKKEKKLLTRKELCFFNFREQGTFTIHIDQDNQLFLGKGGFHRFGIALALALNKVPAQIGVVHRKAITLLKYLRNKTDA